METSIADAVLRTLYVSYVLVILRRVSYFNAKKNITSLSMFLELQKLCIRDITDQYHVYSFKRHCSCSQIAIVKCNAFSLFSI